MFVKLERADKPTWVPDSYIYLDLQSFGVPDLVGAVKAKCARLGVELQPPSPADRARRIAAQEKFKAETGQLLRSSAQPLYDAAGLLFKAIESRLTEIEQETGWSITRGSDNREFAAFTEPVSMHLMTDWLPREPGAALNFRLVRGRVLTSAERSKGLYVVGIPHDLRTETPEARACAGVRLVLGVRAQTAHDECCWLTYLWTSSLPQERESASANSIRTTPPGPALHASI